jgi:hypothetical protein
VKSRIGASGSKALGEDLSAAALGAVDASAQNIAPGSSRITSARQNHELVNIPLAISIQTSLFVTLILSPRVPSVLFDNPEMPEKDSDKSRAPPTDLPVRKSLSPALQKLVDKTDKDENFYDELYDGR